MLVRSDLPACRRLTAAVLACLALPAVAAAQSSSTSSTQSDTTSTTTTTTHELDKVTVTGSRIARAQVEGPAPMMVITAEDIQRQGFTTAFEALSTITQNTGDTNNEMDQTGSTANGQFMNLRSLGPSYTLILLNGKRMANYPQAYGGTSTAVSLGNIPAGAIERIEVLSSGASAIYGSDAIAGVINIITKTDYSGDRIRLRAGTSTRGGGDSGQFQWTGGRSSDLWSLTYAFEHLSREPIMANQRDFMDSYYDNPACQNGGNCTGLSAVYLYSPSSGYLWRGSDGTLSTSTEALEEACAATNPEFETYKSSGSARAVNRCGTFGYPADQSIQNGYNKNSGMLSGTFDFSDSVQGYGQLLLSKSRDISYNRNQYYWSSSDYVYDPELGLVSASRTVTPSEIGGVKPTTYDETSASLNLGLKGTILDGRFDWDFSLTHSQYDITVKRRRFLKNAARDYFLGELQGYTDDGYEIRDVNEDALFSPISAEDYYSITTIVTNEGESSNDQGQFTLSGRLFDLPAGPVQVAVVVEGAKEKFQLNPDERTWPTYTGDEAIYNYTATTGGGSRNHYALGVEFSVPIFERLKASLAGRYDQYVDSSDVGGAFTWQAGLEWRPWDSLLLRGTRATTFRAPDLTYLYSGESSGYSYVTDVYLCRVNGVDPASSACTSGDYYYQTYYTYSGNTDLYEETGKSWSAGFVWDLTPSMSVSADFYHIELYGMVKQIDTDYLMEQYANCMLGTTSSGAAVDTGSASCGFYKSLVTRDSDGTIDSYESYPVNQSMMRTEGVDASWKYHLGTTGWGDFDLKLGYTLTTKLESQLFPGDEIVDERNSLDYYNFRSKANWQVDWRGGDWRASVYGYRWGSLPNYAGTGRIAPYIVWNANLSKRITPKATLGLSVTNLFDKLHPRDDTYTSYPYFNRTYSAVGRQIYADFTYDF